MNDDEMAATLLYIAGNWPNTTFSDATAHVFRFECGALPAEAVERAVRIFAAHGAPFPPSPAHLAELARSEMRPPIPDHEQAYDELMDTITRVGWVGAFDHEDEPDWTPEFSHPLLTDYVRRHGGWRAVCESTPARTTSDEQSITRQSVFKAHFRDEWKAAVGRAESEARVMALDGPTAVDALALGATRRVDDEM